MDRACPTGPVGPPRCARAAPRRGQALVRPAHHVGARAARRELDRARDPVRAERPVRHHAQLAQPEQEGAALRLRVDRVAQPAERGLEQHPAGLGARARHRRLAHRAQQRVRRPFHDLQEDVAGEAVGDDHVRRARADREALHVAGERELHAAGERGVGGDDVLGALGRLGAVGQQRDARARDAHHRLHERGAHVRELDELLGPHVDVRAAVEQQERAPGNGHEHGERRAVDAARSFHVKQAGGERGAGRAAGDQRVGAPVGDGTHGLHDRGVRRVADGAGRIRGLRDRDGRVDHRDAGRGSDLRRRSEDEHAQRAAGGGERGAARHLCGAGVGAVGVERDRQVSGHRRTSLASPAVIAARA